MFETRHCSLHEWRQARKPTHAGITRATGVCPDTLMEWERTGYPAHQDGLRKAIQLAKTYAASLEAIDFGPNVRGFSAADCEFAIATHGHDDRGWEVLIAEWGARGCGTEPPPAGVSERVNSGMLTISSASTGSLDALEEEIR